MRSGMALAAASSAQLQADKPKTGANDRIGVALIGCGGMGSMDLKDFQCFPEVEIVALCDADEDQIAKAQRLVNGKAPRIERDFRKVLASPDVNVVVIATPDHWHALMCVEACRPAKMCMWRSRSPHLRAKRA